MSSYLPLRPRLRWNRVESSRALFSSPEMIRMFRLSWDHWKRRDRGSLSIRRKRPFCHRQISFENSSDVIDLLVVIIEFSLSNRSSSSSSTTNFFTRWWKTTRTTVCPWCVVDLSLGKIWIENLSDVLLYTHRRRYQSRETCSTGTRRIPIISCRYAVISTLALFVWFAPSAKERGEKRRSCQAVLT